MREELRSIKRVVVKIGSHLLEKNSDVDLDFIKDLSDQIKSLQKNDIEVLIVSSGAVLAGIKKLGLKSKPKTVTEKQAVASVGQAYLMQIYDKIFSKNSLIIGQVLLTIEGLQERRRYILAQNTLNKLLEMDVVPVINENDTVAVEEIVFGDNDFLAAHVSVLVNADLLVILSTAGGLYTKDPSEKDAQLIQELSDIDKALKFAGSSKSKFGTGGMRSKLEAAKVAVSHSIPVVIAPKEKGVVARILSGERIGTFIHPEKKRKRSRKKSWLQTLSVAKGIITVDRGAEKAIREGKSLLPAGIKDIEGIFSKNDVVAIQNEDGKIIGKGIVNYSYREIKKIKGLKSKDVEKVLKKKFTEVIHRDNMVVFG
ncbi:MAG TPA: glutamate 5-kinase [Persephonella sp.]|uniref:Glutamate 5-kinase n=1 Tax=Persephonella marina (strain DSM 14350 / EX-H1) TaxID=123214 RepID=C0QQB5_PERMH|nr:MULTISPECIES: glutamate 5-kinase [Persephonella]ACO03364.1 glutamate 5-kinase [Persephonella marina EX-H1]HCB69533.1 glutamate 5-kinase [Persephonella sp.]